jgi:DNA-binding NarL/FixJ family response regulator
VDLFERIGAPFDAGQARIELADSLLASGHQPAAEREARVALEALTRLGAGAEARRARRLLDAAAGPAAPAPKLTRRQREVLQLIVEGLTNRQIAERLVVSEHTVHRHVTNILRKLGAPSRAAAVAHAGRSGLLETR